MFISMETHYCYNMSIYEVENEDLTESQSETFYLSKQ